MSESGQTETSTRRCCISGLPSEADMVTAVRHVSKVPIPEIVVSFDHLVSDGLQSRREFQAERFRGCSIEY
jgi:hypothetical protein